MSAFYQVGLDEKQIIAVGFPCRHFSVTSTGGAILLSKHSLCRENTVCISVVLQPMHTPYCQLMSLLRLSGQQEPEFVRRSGGVWGHGQAWRHDSADCAAQRGEKPLLLLTPSLFFLFISSCQRTPSQSPLLASLQVSDAQDSFKNSSDPLAIAAIKQQLYQLVIELSFYCCFRAEDTLSWSTNFVNISE